MTAVIPRIKGKEKNKFVRPLTVSLSVSTPDCQTEDNIYEELPKNNLQSSEPIIGKIEIETFLITKH